MSTVSKDKRNNTPSTQIKDKSTASKASNGGTSVLKADEHVTKGNRYLMKAWAATYGKSK